MKTNIRLMVQAKQPGIAGWPHINFNYEQAVGQICAVLEDRMPEAEFSVFYCDDPEAAKVQFLQDKENFDGLVCITATNNPPVYRACCELADTQFPVLIADLPHAGSGGFLNAAHRVFSGNLPIGLTSSMDYRDIAENVQIIELLKRLKQEKLLIISDDPDNPMYAPAKREALRRDWGVDSVVKSSSDLFARYEAVPEETAAPLAEKWLNQSIRSIEPGRGEILSSARLYFALQEMMKQEGCTALTVDCLSLFYQNKMKAYPCMTFFEMLNNGRVGICEADVDSALSAMIARHGMERPGFVSDPVLDTSSGQIIYDHCVCSTKMLGYGDPRVSEYYIRSHAEDQQGASVQAMLPLNLPVTTFKFCTDRQALALHTGTAVGNVGLDRGCRTKLAASSQIRNIMKNWNYDVFAWHRVTVYGDWRDKLLNLARMKGLAVTEEDRDQQQ